jgi:hypothetical protein
MHTVRSTQHWLQTMYAAYSTRWLVSRVIHYLTLTASIYPNCMQHYHASKQTCHGFMGKIDTATVQQLMMPRMQSHNERCRVMIGASMRSSHCRENKDWLQL